MVQRFLVDAVGVKHSRAKGKPRIISLVPSITELLFALGVGPYVVGRTRFCVHPRASVGRIPCVGGTKDLNHYRLRVLAPTHVIMNIDENRKVDAEALAAWVPNLIITHPVQPEDNLRLYWLLGGIFGKFEEARHLCTAFRRAHQRIAKAAEKLPSQRVLYVIWSSPWITVSKSTYISRMLSLVRWETIADDPQCRYPTVVISKELLAESQLILFSTEPYHFQQRHIDAFRDQFFLHGHRLALIDGELLSWYGSRAIGGLYYLRAFATAQFV
nr:ABC transporter substrate-binding protein [Gammaproteobacteria bacterium]